MLLDQQHLPRIMPPSMSARKEVSNYIGYNQPPKKNFFQQMRMNNSINNNLQSIPPTAEAPNMKSKNLLNSLDEIASQRSEDTRMEKSRIPTQPSETKSPSKKL